MAAKSKNIWMSSFPTVGKDCQNNCQREIGSLVVVRASRWGNRERSGRGTERKKRGSWPWDTGAICSGLNRRGWSREKETVKGWVTLLCVINCSFSWFIVSLEKEDDDMDHRLYITDFFCVKSVLPCYSSDFLSIIVSSNLESPYILWLVLAEGTIRS